MRCKQHRQPHNLVVDSQGNLWIGEDTSNHKNNVLWMYDGTTLKRFGTVPVGAETPGLRVAADGAMFFNAQHPSARSGYPYNRGVIGVVTGFKAGDAFEPWPYPKQGSTPGQRGCWKSPGVGSGR